MAETPPTIRQALNLSPNDALRAFQARDELAISVSWQDLQPEEHARAFTVAKIAKLDLLATVGESLNKALAQGQTFEQWQKEVQPKLQKAGWWGRVQNRTLTGTDETVLVNEHRLRTIFRTNMRTAHAAGKWARIQRVKDQRPYLLYSAVKDRRTRPQHARWDGIVLPVDHPFWLTHFPPNGWNCRCGVEQLSERDMQREGRKVTTEAELARLAPADPVGQMPFGPPGARTMRPKLPAIDNGWDYNVGAESMLGLVEKGAQTIIRARAAGLDQSAADLLAELTKLLADDMLALLLRLLDGVEPASVQWEDEVAGARKRGRSQKSPAKSAKSAGDTYPNGGRRGQKRDPKSGEFLEEGAGKTRAERRQAHTIQWVNDTVKPGTVQLGNHAIGGLSPRAVALLRDEGLPVRGTTISLSPSHTVHIMQSHGVASEALRGQVAISAADLHKSAALINAASSFKRSTGYAGEHEFSAPRATARVEMDGHRYQLLVEQLKTGTVLRNIWKWKM